MSKQTFRLSIPISPSPLALGYTSPVLFMGSCFAENMGSIAQQYKFPFCVNPFGILYNPFSIQLALERLVSGNAYTQEELHFFNEQWLSWQHHGSFSAMNAEECIQQINFSFKQAVSVLRSAKCLFLTFGTAFYYRLKSSGQVVANCHKVPAIQFDRQLLQVAEITTAISTCIQQIRQFNPDLKVVLTVSPVRHWKDGAAQNQRSKSTLILAAHELCDQLDEVYYFPAYEIMMDELRDHRFYADDMLHPSQQAIDYIWQSFQKAFLTEESLPIMQEVKKIVQASQHRPLHPNRAAHQQFLHKQLDSIKTFSEKHSALVIDWSIEEAIFKKQLMN